MQKRSQLCNQKLRDDLIHNIANTCLNWFDFPPLTRTSKDTDDMQVKIQLMKTKLNPSLVSIA